MKVDPTCAGVNAPKGVTFHRWGIGTETAGDIKVYIIHDKLSLLFLYTILIYDLFMFLCVCITSNFIRI